MLFENQFNFSAGPAMMPRAVMRRAADEFLNWQGKGVSVAEISHRSQDFIALARKTTQALRELLSIPDQYHILFLSGGGQGQFAALPMNLLDDKKSVAYVQTGFWGKKAAIEASRYAQLNLVANAELNGFIDIPPEKTWTDFSDAAYLHYVDNETINGVEFSFVPQSGDVPLVCDMSSNFLSRFVDVSRYGVIYACAQKNVGIAGVTVVIVRDDLLQRKAMSMTPSILNYAKQAESDSMVNTPPTYPWYFAGLVFDWIKSEGGVAVIAQRNAEKAQKLYAYLDQQNFYINRVDPACRSRMNITFFCPTPELDRLFVEKSAMQGLIGLKGHQLAGGIRASIYNAMPIEGIDRLIAFMQEFAS